MFFYFQIYYAVLNEHHLTWYDPQVMGFLHMAAPFCCPELSSTDGQNHEMQVARVPASRFPDARPVPYGITDGRRMKYSIVKTPHVHF